MGAQLGVYCRFQSIKQYRSHGTKNPELGLSVSFQFLSVQDHRNIGWYCTLSLSEFQDHYEGGATGGNPWVPNLEERKTNE